MGNAQPENFKHFQTVLVPLIRRFAYVFDMISILHLHTWPCPRACALIPHHCWLHSRVKCQKWADRRHHHQHPHQW